MANMLSRSDVLQADTRATNKPCEQRGFYLFVLPPSQRKE
jgi:hypothetical protein